MVVDFSRKSKDEVSRKKILLQMGCLLGLFMLAILIIADVKIYHDKAQMLAKIDAYQKQVDQIKQSNQHLQDEIANANNKDYLEQMAYEQLDKQRPGEQEVIFVSAANKPKVAAAPQNPWFGWLTGMFDWMKAKK